MHIFTYINTIVREKEEEAMNLTEGEEGIHRRIKGRKVENNAIIF